MFMMLPRRPHKEGDVKDYSSLNSLFLTQQENMRKKMRAKATVSANAITILVCNRRGVEVLFTAHLP